MTLPTKFATTVSVLALLAFAAPLAPAQQPNQNPTTQTPNQTPNAQNTPTTPGDPGSNARGSNTAPRTAQGTNQGKNQVAKQGANRRTAQGNKGQRTARGTLRSGAQGKQAAQRTTTKPNRAARMRHTRVYAFRPSRHHRAAPRKAPQS